MVRTVSSNEDVSTLHQGGMEVPAQDGCGGPHTPGFEDDVMASGFPEPLPLPGPQHKGRPALGLMQDESKGLEKSLRSPHDLGGQWVQGFSLP